MIFLRFAIHGNILSFFCIIAQEYVLQVEYLPMKSKHLPRHIGYHLGNRLRPISRS